MGLELASCARFIQTQGVANNCSAIAFQSSLKCSPGTLAATPDDNLQMGWLATICVVGTWMQ